MSIVLRRFLASVRKHWVTARVNHAFWLRIAVILLVSFCVTGVAFRIARTLEDQRIVRELEIGTIDRISAVQRGLNEQLGLLDSAAAYWSASGGADAAGFSAFVTPLLRDSPQLTAIGWSPLVTATERRAAEDAARREGLTDFKITERGADGELRAAGQRDSYVPLLYMEPAAGNEAAVGFDLGSEEKRRSVLTAARDTGLLQTSRRLRLVQDRQPRDALMSGVAVYRQGAPLDTVDDRRNALTGFISQVYWIDSVIEAGLASVLPGGIDLHFVDPGEPPEHQTIYTHRSRLRTDASVPAPFVVQSRRFPSYEGHLDVGGQVWRVIAVAAPGFVAHRRGLLPWFLLALGVLATVLGIVFLGTTEKRNKKLQQVYTGLRESEERLRNVVENMPVLMNALDANGKIIAWNRECERVSGYSADEVTVDAQMLGQIYPEASPDGKRQNIEDYRNRERTLIARDRTEHTIAWSRLSNAIPIPGWASWHIGIDVTDRNRADRERREMQEQFLQEQKLDSLGVLAGGIAHDFNNLLTVILGNASLAQESLPAAARARRALDAVVQASERAALLTQQLLAYTGKGMFELKAIDLTQHVGEIVSMLQASLPKKVSLNFALQENLPTIDADPAQMQQLIMNLVINSAEAANDQAGTVFVRTGSEQVSAEYARSLSAGGELRPGPHVYLEIQDDGQGMTADILKRIFEPFFSTKFTGRGLGLSAALGIVRTHRACMTVDSTPGVGSVFKVLFPAVGEAIGDKPVVREDDSHGAGLILVVDDEAMIRGLAEQALTKLGYQVLTVENGVAAIEIFRERAAEIDCVLLDMTMPKLNGLETFRALRAMRHDVTVVLSSGYEKKTPTQPPGETGFMAFLKKPYTVAELGSKIREAIKKAGDLRLASADESQLPHEVL